MNHLRHGETDIALLKTRGVALGGGWQRPLTLIARRALRRRRHLAPTADLHDDKALLEEAAWLESLASSGAGPTILEEAGRRRAEKLARQFRPEWDHIIGPPSILRRRK